MADIALLIVEEYERRTRNSESSGGIQGEKVDMVTCVSLLSRRLNEVSWVNKAPQKFAFANTTLNPKSELTLAAINGFFSA